MAWQWSAVSIGSPRRWAILHPSIRESSNALKCAVTAAVGGLSRTEPHRQDLSLLSGELIRNPSR